ncbi:DNA polymerase III subunit gamma and tau [Saccharothrix violaceirubra]|uniref:DNA polymerase III subunit gamma/tau n=1 Tax=Saccharothrix violaceirubra TaxID=413306 RepID=A0A7W7T9E7_9PSEU|nr:DNA polymerase III subunit gamma and tau [Saccharothrix violaceirubra]MBB4969013.1 DNA polymerase-3 subunit gamma/tau [Saccharothrix violaceirubra]
MALALYRKYRPATFAEVVGQEHVTDPLRTALGAGRVNHAYLFSGPRGCGKTSSARILARSLNCANGPTADPCGECNSCVGLAPNGPGSVDVVELDAASHGGVDDARELRDKAFYAPAEARYRVFIIDEAHMVTTQGFNALLKIVEEPPEHLIFIFATTEPDKVLPTIRSRTHHYPFRLIPPVAMRALLERNCAAEGVAVDPAVLPLVIRAGGGSARDTQSVMDQLLSGAGPGGVTYEGAISLLGVTDVALIDEVVDGLATGDGSAVFGTIDRLVDAGHDPRRFASDLLDRLRDLVLMHAVPDAADRGLVSAPADQLVKMAAQREATRPATVTRWAEVLHQGLTEMRGSTAPRLLLELVSARMLLPSASDAESAVLQRVERLERYGPPAGAVPALASATPPPADTRFQRPSQRTASAQAQAQAQAAPDQAPAEPDAAEPDPGTRDAGVPRESTGSHPSQTATPESRTPAAATRNSTSQSQEAATQSGHTQATQPETAQARPVQARSVQPQPGQTQARPTPAGTGQAGTSQGVNGQGVTGGAADGWPATRPVPGQEPAAHDSRPQNTGTQPTPTATGANTTGTDIATDTGIGTDSDTGIDVNEVRRRWPDLRASVRTTSRSTEAMLTNATVLDVEGTAVTLSHPSAPLARRLAEPRNCEAIAAAFTAVFGGTWQVRCVHGDASAAPTRPAAPQRPQRPVPTRASQAQQTPRTPPTRPSAADDVPLPPEPSDPEEPEPEPVDEEEMLAEAARPADPDRQQLDPESVVLQLLAEHLGARPLKG